MFLTAACKAVVRKQVRRTTRGSIPSQPTRPDKARSSNGRIPGPQPGDAGSTPVRATYGEVVESVDTRRSERRARQGRASSTLAFVTSLAGAAGAQLALIRPVSPVRYRGLQLDGRVRKLAKRRGREPRDFAHFATASVTDNMIPWSNGEDAWMTPRRVMVRFHPGSLDGL